MNSIETRKSIIVETFKAISSWDDRYKKLIEMGKALSGFEDQFHVDQFKLVGCQSQVWLYPKYDSKTKLLYFYADSDAMIGKGMIALLLDVYSGNKIDDILTLSTDFLDDIGLKKHLSMSRSNGINAMLRQIISYALMIKKSEN